MVQKLLLVLTLALQACSTKEFIVDSERTQEAVGGFVKNAPFSLGKPNTFSQGVLEDWQKMGIYVSFDDHAKIHKVSVYQGTRFATSRGIKIGDGIEKVEQVYGRPKQKKIRFW